MKNYDPLPDLRFLVAASTELEAYLLSREMYWPMKPSRGEPPLPRLSIGGLFLSLAKLSAVQGSLAAGQATAYRQATVRIEATRTRWAAAVGRKIQPEASSHLHLWQAYLDDLAEAPERNLERYPDDVRERVLLSLLSQQPESDLPEEGFHRPLRLADQRLEFRFRAGDFVWDARLQPGFPRTTYWFLYGRPGPLQH